MSPTPPASTEDEAAHEAHQEAHQEAADDGRLSYEDARDELVDTVRRLEAGGTSLEESLALWERGERLAGICEARLEGARRRLDAAVGGADAEPGDGSGEDTAAG